MADQAEGLGARLGGAFRQNLADQAKAYKDYGALLQRWSAKEVKTVEFARDAIDIYVGALGKTAAAGVAAAGEVVGAGAKRASSGAAEVAAVAEAVKPVSKPRRATRKPAKRPPAKPSPAKQPSAKA